MYRDRIWTLMSRKLIGEATTAELSELDELIKIHPEVDLPTQLVQEYWNIPVDTDDEEFLEATFHLHTEILSKKGFQLNSNHTETGSLTLDNQQNSRKKRRLLFVAATCILVVSMVGSYIYLNSNIQKLLPNKIAKAGKRTFKPCGVD